MNALRNALEAGETVLGARVRTNSTTAVQLIGQAGLDYVYMDLEHSGCSPFDSPALERVLHEAEHAGTSVVVRVPTADPSMVRAVLDTGVRTVVVPRVESAGEVRRVVAASQFTHDGGPGERGYGTGPENDWGARPSGWTEAEDDSVLVGVMLETASAMDEASAISSVSGLGFAKVGVGDLAVALGRPQEVTAPEVVKAVETFESTCRSAGVPLGRGTTSTEEAQEALAAGYQLVEVGGDVEVMRSAFRERREALEE